MSYLVASYYRFTPIEDPQDLVAKNKAFFEKKEATGRVYISHEGINGQISGKADVIEAYMTWIQEDPRFSNLRFNLEVHHENVFPRMTIKIRKQLVALDETTNPNLGGTYLSPQEWKEMLEDGEEKLLLDVRNDYEWEIGHFEGSELPKLEQFREFPAYADDLKEKVDPKKTRVMMCCTGGIRCELYSALMKARGFDQVYQLEGGILNYGKKVGSDHWKGKLFVFDDRLAVPIDGKEAEPIAKCSHCEAPADTYYNCSNMECNELFIACDGCHETLQGCCCTACQQSGSCRPYKKDNKPFRRKHLIVECALTPKSSSESET